MVKLFVVLGLVLLAGGAYAIVDGWPYLVLERGFTEVILGAMAATAGLILLALAAVLAEVRRLKGMVGSAMTVMSLAEPRVDMAPAAGVAAPPAEGPSPAVREAQHAGLAPALAAGAGALAVGGALAGLARIGSGRDDAESAAEAGEAAEAEKPAEEPGAPAVAAEEQAPSPAQVEHDDWFAPPDPASLHRPVVAQDTAPEPASAEAVEASQEAAAAPTPSEPPAAEAPEAVAEAPVPAGPSAPAAAEGAGPEAEDEAQPVEATSAKEELWWPRIERPSRDATLSDEFSALRAELSGLSREVRPEPELEAPRGEAPDVGAPRRDLDSAGDWMAPRPWPPVTQPRSLDMPAGPEPEGPEEAAVPEAEEAAPPALEPEPASLAEPPAADEPAQEADTAPEAEEAPAVEAAAAESAEAERPAASEEGVVGAYQVGETQFTMYADGSIHARTPDGDYVFASMDELKTYLASEKSRLEA